MALYEKSEMDILKTIGSAVTILAMGLVTAEFVYCAVKGLDSLRYLLGRRTNHRS
jgi:energy-converting hydrogenase Eha subunit G